MIQAAVSRPCLACDTDTKLTASTARALAAADVPGEPDRIRAVARYVGLTHANPDDIDAEELQAITGAGLAVWLVQHVLATNGHGWTPSGQLGRLHGGMAKQLAYAAGYPAGAHLALDLEDVAPGTTSQMVIDHCDAWAEMVGPMFSPALYVGFSTGLTGEQLYELPGFRLYWSDYGNRYVYRRGCAVKQFRPNVDVAGIKVDLDRVGVDMLGGQLTWAEAAGTEAA